MLYMFRVGMYVYLTYYLNHGLSVRDRGSRKKISISNKTYVCLPDTDCILLRITLAYLNTLLIIFN